MTKEEKIKKIVSLMTGYDKYQEKYYRLLEKSNQHPYLSTEQCKLEEKADRALDTSLRKLETLECRVVDYLEQFKDDKSLKLLNNTNVFEPKYMVNVDG